MRPGLLLGLCLLMASPCWAAASRDFDGTDDYLDFGDTTLVDGLGAVTVVAWFNGNVNWDSARSIIRKNNSFTPLQGFTTSTGVVQMAIWSSTTIHLNSDLGTPSTNAWHRHATYWDSTIDSGFPGWVLDGVDDGRFDLAASASTGTIDNSVAVMRMGTTETSTEDTDGQLGYVQYWNRKLTLVETEQALLMPGTIADGLIAYWPLLGDTTEKSIISAAPSGTATGSTGSADGPPVLLTAMPL